MAPVVISYWCSARSGWGASVGAVATGSATARVVGSTAAGDEDLSRGLKDEL